MPLLKFLIKNMAVLRFININMNFLGHIPQDDFITISSRSGGSVMDQFPNSDAAKAINQLCHSITHWQNENVMTGGIQFFFERLIHNRPSTKEPACIV
jgi:MinD-like ATPase involved in chromosome partitioning or flagellar assembly